MQFIECCAFAKSPTPIWPNHFYEKEIFAGTQECSFGRYPQCSANSIVRRRSWQISFPTSRSGKFREDCASALQQVATDIIRLRDYGESGPGAGSGSQLRLGRY